MSKSQKIAKVIIEENSECENSDSDNIDKKLESTNDSPESEMECDEELDEDSKACFNEKWADSIAKILKCNKPKKKKGLVLSKAKKLTDGVKVKVVKQESYEIATNDGQIKRETVFENKIKATNNVVRKTKKELPSFRVKPDILQKDKERILQKIATRGVVQLFNTVKTQQKDIDTKLKKAGPLETRKEKVLRDVNTSSFLETLMSEPSVKISRNKTDML